MTTRTKGPLALGLAVLVVAASLPPRAWADGPSAPPAPAPPAPAPPPSVFPPPAPSVALPPAPPAPVEDAAPPPPPPPSGVSRDEVAWAAAGIAAAGAIGATVFGVLALNSKSSYEQSPTVSSTDNGNNFAAYTDGCIFLAAAAGITSLVLFLTGAPPPADASAAPRRTHALLSAAPVVTPHGGGAGAVLRF